MVYPRRVRRRLLLPPGWVALGFLLLLGCQALRAWERQLRPMSVLQITLPALKPEPEEVKNFGENYAIPYKKSSQLSSFRPWHNVSFRGNSLLNFLSAATTELVVKQIIADSSHDGGVRVRFLPGATYANLVRVLDIMRYTGQKKYWLGIRHQPVTLYAITMRQEHLRRYSAPFSLGCCTCGPYQLRPESEAAWYQKVQGLRWKPWQPIIMLVALIGVLNVWSPFCLKQPLRL